MKLPDAVVFRFFKRKALSKVVPIYGLIECVSDIIKVILINIENILKGKYKWLTEILWDLKTSFG